MQWWEEKYCTQIQNESICTAIKQFNSFYSTVEIIFINNICNSNLKPQLLVYNSKSVPIVLQIRL